MCADLIVGLGCGMAVYYLVYTMVFVDGWATVNRILGFAPRTLESTDDIVQYVGLKHPMLAQWMSCPYCMTPWFSLAAVLLCGFGFLRLFFTIGFTILIYQTFERD